MDAARLTDQGFRPDQPGRLVGVVPGNRGTLVRASQPRALRFVHGQIGPVKHRVATVIRLRPGETDDRPDGYRDTVQVGRMLKDLPDAIGDLLLSLRRRPSGQQDRELVTAQSSDEVVAAY
ncbi:hypothetical protein [Kineosporia babensis]|uniref:Uncharacterized protein n=1 Tax=Kineosporia babensis TaxID=499548 RepID=A0A9X1NPH0_9ACTN|nr:hypothetical protein [Kineosporia babensis]MCD5317239.1 hypothetical protein [Kineosporia babensis]